MAVHLLTHGCVGMHTRVRVCVRRHASAHRSARMACSWKATRSLFPRAGLLLALSTCLRLRQPGCRRWGVSGRDVLLTDFLARRCSRSGISGGRWMYQVSVDTGGHVQVGWVTSQCHLSHASAVGHTPYSIALDGIRAQRSQLLLRIRPSVCARTCVFPPRVLLPWRIPVGGGYER